MPSFQESTIGKEIRPGFFSRWGACWGQEAQPGFFRWRTKWRTSQAVARVTKVRVAKRWPLAESSSAAAKRLCILGSSRATHRLDADCLVLGPLAFLFILAWTGTPADSARFGAKAVEFQLVLDQREAEAAGDFLLELLDFFVLEL